MKKLVFTICSFSLLALISFTEKSISYSSSAEKLLAKTLVGNWIYSSVLLNGEPRSLDSCDEMDYLKFDPSGRFESLQHARMINAKTGEGTTTTCNSVKINGNWSVATDGKLLRDNLSVEVFEITETTLKLKSIVTSINEGGETIKDVYVDCYVKR